MTDKPKTWGEMTREEKGALLLAHHKEEVIDYWEDGSWHLSYCGPGWSGETAYRIKPEHKVETIVMYGRAQDGFGDGPRLNRDTHRLTFNVIDGEIDCDSVKLEEL